MSLPTPDLDVRKFQEIVDDVKRQIGLRCPEWTEHNVSDPGVTMIELFAYMTEMALYRMNQVPEKNYIKFLDLIGIRLEMPEPAQTDLRFRLSRPIEDRDGTEEHEQTLKARETIAATTRTESEHAIEFALDRSLKLVRPRLMQVLALPESERGVAALEDLADAREFKLKSGSYDEKNSFSIYSPLPRTGDALYFGFSNDVSGNTVELVVDCLNAAATGLNESYPAQVWEYWDGVDARWERLEVVDDGTFGFNRPGGVELAMPHDLQERSIGGTSGYWVRVLYTIDASDLPPRGLDQKGPDAYQKPPEITSVQARTVGGTAPSSQCTSILNEILGQSDGTPGQVFQLLQNPVVRLQPSETILVGPIGNEPGDLTGWEEWTCVDDFAESESTDRHFVLDHLTGEIFFGPNIVQPDGSARQYGAIPEKGMTVLMAAYRFGGGTHGNVREGKVRTLKKAIPFISEVTNPRIASGGRDREELERAKLRAREVLRVRNRAVSAEDFELLARKASSGVGRAKCIQPVTYPPRTADGIYPGIVRVLIIPTLSDDLLLPRPADLRVPLRTIQEVHEYLDGRRLLTSVLEVQEPEYVFVSVDLKIVADPRADEETVALRVQESLSRFLHPLQGGYKGDGWSFRRPLTLADVYSQVGAVRGVAFLLDAKMFASRIANHDEGVLGPETLISNAEGLTLSENEMLCSRRHTIRVVPMEAVGKTEAVLSD